MRIFVKTLISAVMFQEIEFGSDDFRKECELRNEVLRLPLGLNLFDEDINLEAQQMHYGLFDQNGNLVACVIAVSISSSETKLRQMAVNSRHQGKGLGRTIIQSIEDWLSKRGITYVFAHARITVCGFYEKLGYVKVGSEFTELGIPHIRMEKYIRPNSVDDSDKHPGELTAGHDNSGCLP